MSSKYLCIPEDVVLKNLITDQILVRIDADGNSEPIVISFYEFIVSTLLKDARFGANAVTVMYAIEIKDKIEGIADGTCVGISDEAYNILADTLNNPSNPFNPEVVIQLGTFLRAILEAEDSPLE